MKKSQLIGLGLGIAVLLAIIGIDYLQNQTSYEQPATNTQATPTNAPAATISMDTVKQHNTATDCYVAINGNVHDLTSWIKQHPGGDKAILGLCGTDGTQAFMSQHGRNQQAQTALNSFIIGKLQ